MTESQQGKAGPKHGAASSAASQGAPAIPDFTFGMPNLDDEPEVPLSLPPSGERKAMVEVMQGIDLSGLTRVVLVAGRGKTGKTTALRWMAETALQNNRPLLMADLDPTNSSFSAFFQGVKRPDDADNAVATLAWLIRLIQHAAQHKVNLAIDLGGGDMNLRRLVDQMPELVAILKEAGAAPALFYHVGAQPDDLTPVAMLEQRGFRPEATAIVMNEAAIDPGQSIAQAFARIHRHSVFRAALVRGAVPVYMPKLFNAADIEARRLPFFAARDGGSGPGGTAAFGIFDRARIRLWLEAMERQFAGVRTWLP